MLGEARTLLEDVMQRGKFEYLEQSLDLPDPCKARHLRERAKTEDDIKGHDSDQINKEPSHYIVNRNILLNYTKMAHTL